MTTSRTLFLCLALAGLSTACGGIEASTGTEGESTDSPPASGTPAPPATHTTQTLTGVTEDGQGIIFAGPGATSPTTTPPGQRPIDRSHLIMEPNAPDPNANWSLDDALVGLPVDGDLIVEIQTDFGVIFCDLYPDRAPHAVAAFVGLARGRRAWWDAAGGQWVTRPYYRGLTFHRVLPEYIIQGGDYLGDGSGRVGFTVPLERSETLSHDRIGRLALATFNDDPNSGGAQFYITDGPHQELDGTATIFGQCTPDHVVSQIARVVQTGAPDNRPLTPVRMGLVHVRRQAGGASAATPTVPHQPEGEPEVGRGASPGPSILQQGRGRLFPEHDPEHPIPGH
jgi:peptidyl-prolyl cis-trans isomerase A (cyclophilin A)